MLVMSRKSHEIIDIGDDIYVQIIEIRGDKVRIGIEAPKHIKVHRREVTEIIRASKSQGEQAQENSSDSQDSNP